ncbi:MAG: hypothetical protein AAFR62_07195, partial [Cyanobacteria bacterium J06629_2]
MNNLFGSSEESGQSSTTETILPKSALLRRLYNLPINRKTNLIPWFSFGGLALVLGMGSFMLQGTLKQQLSEQTKSQLRLKSDVLLLSEAQLQNKTVLELTIGAFTEEQGYSAVYAVEADGNPALVSSLLNQTEA